MVSIRLLYFNNYYNIMNNPKSSRSLLFLICLLIFNCLNANFSFDELNDYAAAKHRAGEDGKLIFIAFSANWCMPCKILEESTLNNPEIKAILSKDYISVKIDIENQKGHQWKDKFQVQLVPTIIILDSKGKILNKTESTLASSPFKSLIESYNISQNKQVIYARKQFAKNPYQVSKSTTSSPKYSSTYSKPYTKKKTSSYTKPSTTSRRPVTNTRSTSSSSKTIKRTPSVSTKSQTRKYTSAKRSTTSSKISRKKSRYHKTSPTRKKPTSKRSKSISKKRKKASKKRLSSRSSSNKKPIAKGNVYKVKIGNYSKYEAAKKSLLRVQKLNLGSAKILEYKEGRKSRYKIIVGRFYQRVSADTLLKSLNRKGYQGSVVAYKQ